MLFASFIGIADPSLVRFGGDSDMLREGDTKGHTKRMRTGTRCAYLTYHRVNSQLVPRRSHFEGVNPLPHPHSPPMANEQSPLNGPQSAHSFSPPVSPSLLRSPVPSSLAGLFPEERLGWRGYVEWERYPERKALARELLATHKFPFPPGGYARASHLHEELTRCRVPGCSSSEHKPYLIRPQMEGVSYGAWIGRHSRLLLGDSG